MSELSIADLASENAELLPRRETLVILNGPALVRTLARSLSAGQQAAVAQFGRAEIAAGLVTVISTVLLVLPMAGLAYILCRVSRTTFRRAVLATRGRPALRFLAAAGILVAAAGLTVHWGVLPLRAGATPRASVAGQPVGQLTGQHAGQRPDRAMLAGGRPGCRERRPGAVLERVRAVEFDTLEALGRKKGSGLILDMGRRVSVSSVMIKFGRQRARTWRSRSATTRPPPPGCPPSGRWAAPTASAGRTPSRSPARSRGRYVLARFTKLPSAGAGRFAAGTFTIVIRGSA